ncbi:uncharacterized protein LOC144439674 [Glandiceps talaboti]
MKSFLIICCLAVAVQNTYALQCYQCSQQYEGDNSRTANDNSDCKEVLSCDDDSLPTDESYDTCYSFVQYDGHYGKLKIQKGCYGSYSAHSYDDCMRDVAETAVDYHCNTDFENWKCVHCCQGNLCNTNGVTMVMANMVTLMMAVMMVFFFSRR